MNPSPGLHVGDRAPQFTLPDQNGKKFRLSEARGKHPVVLVFYPGDMTPGCTVQLCALRDEMGKFHSRHALVFGVNHGDAASHERFIKKHALPFPLLVDKGKRVSEKYGATRRFFKTNIIRRSVVVIDADGRIAYLKRGMPKNSDILKTLT
ncbi:peroxiredoxin [Candidatus Uhrbacteria bacterium]|nr:peroxiredoxin [Candidatus Uhrbacteria bacterium]